MGDNSNSGRVGKALTSLAGDLLSPFMNTTDPIQTISPEGNLHVKVESQPNTGCATCSKTPLQLSQGLQSKDVFVPPEMMDVCMTCVPEFTPTEGIQVHGISIYTDPKTGIVQINMPDYLLEVAQDFAKRENISPLKLPELLFKVIEGRIMDPESGELLTPEEIRTRGYAKLFEGNVSGKIVDAIQNDSKLQTWYQQNKLKVQDNFRTNFNAHGGMYMLSVFSLMGLAELADVIGIEDPAVRLAFILGPLKPVNRISSYVYAAIQNKMGVKIRGYHTVDLFKPNVSATPILKVEFPKPAEISGRTAASVEHNIVSIRFQIQGAGAKQFLKGLISSFFPPGETTLIRAGRTFVGIVKFPVNLFHEFANLGAGVVAQTIWTQTLGRLIPDNFLYGVPKHFMEIFMLLSPYMAEGMAGATLRPKIGKFVHHPAFKVVGYGLVLDLSAIISTWLVNLGNSESSMYILSTYFRAAESGIPILKHIPAWVPFRTYVATFLGGINYKEVERFEALDQFLSKITQENMRQSILKVLMPDVEGKEWVDFAKAGGFTGVDLSFLGTVGTARAQMEDFSSFIEQLKLLTSLDGMPMNNLFGECFSDSWFKNLETDELMAGIEEGIFDDEELFDYSYRDQFLIFLMQKLSNIECEDSANECLSWMSGSAESQFIDQIKMKFSAEWVEKDFDLLTSLYYFDVTKAKMAEADLLLKAFGVDDKSPYWGAAEVHLNQIEKQMAGKPFDPSFIDKLADWMEKLNTAGQMTVPVLIQNNCAYALWLRLHMAKIQKGAAEKIESVKDLQETLPFLSPSDQTGEKALEWWFDSADYASAIVKRALKRTDVGHLEVGVVTFIKEQIELVEKGETAGDDSSENVGNLRLIYPELIKHQFEMKNNDDPYALHLNGLVSKIEKILTKNKNLKTTNVQEKVLIERHRQLQTEILDSFHQAVLSELISMGSSQRITAGHFNIAFDRVWSRYQEDTHLGDMVFHLKEAQTIQELLPFDYGILSGVKSGEGLQKATVQGRILPKVASSLKEMNLIKSFDDLRSQSVKTIASQFDSLVLGLGGLAEKMTAGAPAREAFLTFWKMVESEPSMAAVKRKVVDLVTQYFFYRKHSMDYRYLDPSSIEIEGLLSKLKESVTLDEKQVLDKYEDLKGDAGAINGFLSMKSHTPYVHFIVRLMQAVHVDCPPALSLWKRNFSEVTKWVDDEFEPFLGGKKSVPEAVADLDPDIQNEVMTAIYDYQDYGQMEVDESESHETPPTDLLHIPADESSREGYTKMLVMSLRFKLAWKAAQLQGEGLLEEAEYREIYGAIQNLNAIVQHDDLTSEGLYSQVESIFAISKRLDDSVKERLNLLRKPLMVEIFNSDGSLKQDGAEELYRYIQFLKEEKENN